MSEDYSLARKHQEVQRVEVSRADYRTISAQRSRNYTAPHEEDIGSKGRAIGRFLDFIM